MDRVKILRPFIMEERVSSTSSSRNLGVVLWTQTEVISHIVVRHSSNQIFRTSILIFVYIHTFTQILFTFLAKRCTQKVGSYN